MLNPTRLLLALTILAMAATVMAAFEGQPTSYPVTITLQITDDRALKSLWNVQGYPGWDAPQLVGMDLGYFTAGKNFTIIIRDLNQKPDLSRFHDLRITLRANGTEAQPRGGFLQTVINVYSTEEVPTDWYVAIVLNDWPQPGYSWLLINGTIHGATILDVLWMLGGNVPYDKLTITPKTVYYVAPNGDIDSGPRGYFWGILYRSDEQNFTKVHTSAIHLWFLRVTKPISLTYKTVVSYTIGNSTITLYDVSRNATLTSRIRGGDVFGPFYYVGTLVKDFTKAGDIVKLYRYDEVVRKMKITVKATLLDITADLITSENNIGDVRIIDQNNNVLAVLPAEFVTYDFVLGGKLFLESGALATWNVPTASVTVNAVYDLKGNPIISPEYITLKAQQYFGGNAVELQVAQLRLKGGVGQFFKEFRDLCSNKLGKSIETAKDIVDCYRALSRDDIIGIYKNLVEPATLSFIAGSLSLKDDSYSIKTETVAAKLVAEYAYTGSGFSVSAVVGVYPVVVDPQLAQPQVELVVSLLPVRIILYQWTGDPLPDVPYATLGQYLSELAIKFQGGGLLVERKGTEALVKNLWTNTYMIALPPYDVPMGMVGNVEIHVASLFNASGLLPLSPVYGIITNDPNQPPVIYLNNIADRGLVRIEDGSVTKKIQLFGKDYDIDSLFKSVGVTTPSVSQKYTLELYLGDIRVGIARLESGLYIITSSGTIVEEQENLERALHALYMTVPEPNDVYAAAVVLPGRLYWVQHEVYVALTTFVFNILPRDMCGSPLAGGVITAEIYAGKQKYSNRFSIQSYASELPIPLAIPVNPDGTVTADHVNATFALDYFGYKLYAVNASLKPVVYQIGLPLPSKKIVVTFPISPILFSVWSQTPDGKLKERLSGFVVSVFSTAAADYPEISRSISNLTRYGDIEGKTKYGYALAEGVPLGVPFRVVVRTIIPAQDSVYPYTARQISLRNSYWAYAEDLKGTPTPVVVYTLGTRDKFDEGVVVLDKTYVITEENYTKYLCAKEDIRLPVEVFDLRVYVYDSTGKYLLRSVPIDLGPFPGASRPILSNVTLIVYDNRLGGGRYDGSSRYLGGLPWISTSYSVIGMTGVRSLYYDIAGEYAKKMADALNCRRERGKTPDWATGTYYMSYVAFFNRIANVSTDSFDAVFTVPSQQPKVVGDPCDVYNRDYKIVGTQDVARLFIKGQRYRFIVWYMGYKVFDDWVTITSPNVTIRTSVVPVTVQPVAKCCGTNVTAFVGFTFADSMTGVAARGIDLSFARSLLKPFDYLQTVDVNQLVSRVPYTSYMLSGGATVYKNFVPPGQTFGSYYAFSAGTVIDLVPNYATVHNGTSVKYGTILLGSTATQPVEKLVKTGETSLSVRGTYAAQITITPADYVKIVDMKFDNNNKLVAIRVVANASDVAQQILSLTYSIDNAQKTYAADYVELNITITGGWLIVQPAGFTVMAASGDSGVFDLRMSARLVNYTKKVENVPVAVGREEAVGLYRWLSTPGGDIYASSPKYVALEWPNDRILSWVLWAGYGRFFSFSYDSVNKRWEASAVLSTYDGQMFQLLSFRTLVLWLPVRQYSVAVGEVKYRTFTPKVRIEARFANNDTLIDYAEFTISPSNTTEYVYMASVDLLTLNWTYGKLPALAKYIDPATGSGVSIRFNIYITGIPKPDDLERWLPVIRHPITGSVLTGYFYSKVPFFVTYDVDRAGDNWVTIDGKLINRGVYTIYTTPVYDYVSGGKTYSIRAALPQVYVPEWLAPLLYGEGGFGAPITYIVKGGDVALLPAWAAGSATYGSRIARIWVFTFDGPALGTTKLSDLSIAEWVARDGSGKISRYDFSGSKYLVVNFVPKVVNASRISKVYYAELLPPVSREETYLGRTYYTLSGRTTGLGFGTGGTSTVVLSTLWWTDSCVTKSLVAFWNSTELASLGVAQLPTTALTSLDVKNKAEFPIYVAGVEVKYGGDTYAIDTTELKRLDSGQRASIGLRGYGFGLSYFIEPAKFWNYTSTLANYSYTALAYHGGVVDALNHFGIKANVTDILKRLEPLRVYVSENVLYASHAEEQSSGWLLAGQWTRGTWDEITTDASNCDFKYVFSFQKLLLVEIRDWNDRPLANQTVVLYGVKYNEKTKSYETKIYAVSYTDSDGRLVYVLPNITSMVVRVIGRVSWYDGFLRELAFGKPEYTIWVYDSSVDTDVKQLGNATKDLKIRTWVYPLTVTVLDVSGKPLSDMWVKVYDISTTGHLVNALNRTASDGGAQVVDLRVSKYASGVMSQIPPTSYYYEVYDSNGILVASGKFDIQRGATVPSTGWNVQVRVSFISEIPVKNSATRGYMVVKGVKFINGTTKDVVYPFTVAGGVMKIQGRVPLSYSYPVEVYVTHVTLGGQEVPVKGGKFLVYKGTTADLAAGLDFAELGLTGVVSISAVDSTGAPRSDWTVQVLYGDIVAAEGKGSVNTVLPRTDVLDRPYTVRVVTNAFTPEGKALVKEQALEVKQKALAVQIPISTVRVVVQAVDGFGNVRSDWPVVVENVASGMGRVEAEVVEGQRYVARATGLGFTNTTAFEARGPQMVVTIKIPTAKITAQVKDGFGKVRSDWPVEVVGVAAGQGTVGPVEVLAGQYTVKTSVFGKEFTQPVTLKAGEAQTVTVQVPTAVLSVAVVDDDRKPIDRWVTAVEISGPVAQSFSTPPKDLEVLEGQYNIVVTAFGKQATAQVALKAGERKTVEVVVLGTAGITIGDTRIPLPTLVLYALLLLVIVVILAIIIIEYNNWRRRRLMQILAPPK